MTGGGWKWGNIMPTATFQFDGEHVFLTYPRCNLERSRLRDFFNDLAPNSNHVIARELHEDGTPHLHAYIHFGRRRRFASVRSFDVDGHHPNVQKPRNAKQVIAYCRKEDAEALVSPGLANVQQSNGGWGELLELSGSREEFLDRTREMFPRDHVLSLEKLLFYAEWAFGRDETPYTGRARDGFREPPSLTEWVLRNLSQVLTYIPYSSVTPTGSTPFTQLITNQAPSGAPTLARGYRRI